MVRRFFHPPTPEQPLWLPKVDEVLRDGQGDQKYFLIYQMKLACVELIRNEDLIHFEDLQDHLLKIEAPVLLIAQPNKMRHNLMQICVDHKPREPNVPRGPLEALAPHEPPEYWLDIQSRKQVLDHLAAFAILETEHRDRLKNKTGVLISIPYYE